MFQYEHLDATVLSPETLPPISFLMQELQDYDPDSLKFDSRLSDLPPLCKMVPDRPIDRIDEIHLAHTQPLMRFKFFNEEIQDPVATPSVFVASDHGKRPTVPRRDTNNHSVIFCIKVKNILINSTI